MAVERYHFNSSATSDLSEVSYNQLSKYLKLKLHEVEKTSEKESNHTVVMEDLSQDPNPVWLSQYNVEILKEIRKTLFEDLEITKPPSLNSGRETLSMLDAPLPGDVLIINKSNPDTSKQYTIITSIDSGGRVYTFPATSEVDLRYVTHVYRFDILSDDNAAEIISKMNQTIEDAAILPKPRMSVDINVPVYTEEPRGLLQIGDIKFLIAPTQMSFTTQNGYQHFPTVRTKGNPKLPTLAETKSLNFTLIFPNTEAINNQLVPLYAMFKRTPFVNLYNRDISEFYSTIRNRDTKYIPVALESITVESVTGFPNTLQANITVLPFQHKGVGETFEALKTFGDVKSQQYLKRDISEGRVVEQIEARLENREATPHSNNMLTNVIHSSDNFEKSEPFRAFYQSLIAERKYVENDLGEIVYKTDGSSIPLSTFRPKHIENQLHYYSAQANKKNMTFTYEFIPQNLREFSDDLRALRKQEITTLGSETAEMLKIITSRDSKFKNFMREALINRQTFYDQIGNHFKKAERYIHDFLGFHRINIDSSPGPEITNLLELLLEVGAHQFPVTAWVTGTGRGVVSTTADLIKNVSDGNYSLGNTSGEELLNILNGVMTWYEGPDETRRLGAVDANTLSDIISDQILDYLDAVSDSKENGESEKEKWAQFFDRFFKAFVDPSIIRNLSAGQEIVAFKTERDIIEIDNVNDVVNGWGLQFSNKLVPIHLNGFQFPYYQHVGCDDVNIFLNIKSIQGGRDQGLKERLSLLNERLHTTTKIVTYNAPELITHLDPRLSVSVQGNDLGHIFNVFGIRKVVYNGSNVSSVEGKPDCWSINLNLTQANFTLKDYQSIVVKKSISGIEDEVANLLLRSRITPDGGIEVIDYKVNTDRLKDLDSVSPEATKGFVGKYFGDWAKSMIPNSTKDLVIPKEYVIGSPDNTNIFGDASLSGEQTRRINNMIMSMTFYKRFIQEAYEQWRGTQKDSEQEAGFEVDDNFDGAHKNSPDKEDRNSRIGKALQYMTLLFNPGSNNDKWIIQEVKNESDTVRLNKSLGDLKIKTIYKGIVNDMDNLHYQHAGVLMQGAERARGYWEILWYDLRNNSSGFIAGTIFGALLCYLAGAGTFVWTVFTGIASLLGFGIPGVKTGKEAAVAATFDILSESLPSLMNGIKSSVVQDMVNNIIRDPVARRKFFDNKYEDIVGEIYSSDGMNCYEDFDIPTNFLAGYTDANNDPLGIKFSPDFYLFDKDFTGIEKYSYVNQFIDTTSRMAKLALQLTLEENKEVIEKLKQVEELIFDASELDSVVKRQLYDEVSMTTDGGTNTQTNQTIESDINNKLEELKDVYVHLALDQRNNKVNPDAQKLNLMRSARNKRVLELKVIQTAINLALAGSKLDTDHGKDKYSGTNQPAYLSDDKSLISDTRLRSSLEGASYQQLRKMADLIRKYFRHYTNEEQMKHEEVINKDTPSIRFFEETVYTLVTQLIILGDAIAEFESGNLTVTSLLTDIPEMGLLDWYNWRNIDDINDKKISLMSDFLEEDTNRTRGYNQKMFPTFKVFFVEEDGKTISVDDYYAYNAVQSIDIIKNKYSASSTAVIKLGNVYGNLTNKISLMKESDQILDILLNQRDNRIFLGSLDIKPGVKIIVKMGYGANDRDLKIVFIGKVVEMSAGPITELVAQSYGAQLSHEITKMHFGVLNSRKEHGDIASAVLDAIPSLDGLGKPSLLGLNPVNYSGRRSAFYDGTLFDRFLMSNITTRVNTTLFQEDNPRDENIYLPVDLIPDITKNVTFDWIVYNQTVWQALHELSLYHDNTIPIIRPYNDGMFSTLDDARETIVVGKKSGWYKHTDAFRYTTRDIDKLGNLIDDWNTKYWKFLMELRQKIQKTRTLLIDAPSGQAAPKDVILAEYLVQEGLMKKEVQEVRKTGIDVTVTITNYYPRGKLKNLLVGLSSKQLALVVTKAIEDNAPQVDTRNLGTMQLLVDTVARVVPGIWETTANKLRTSILKVGFNEAISDRKADEVIVMESRVFQRANSSPGTPTVTIRHSIFDVILNFGSVPRRYENFVQRLNDLKPYQFLGVSAKELDNNQDKFVNDPRYRKIQRQHLITDTSDIISNEIVLSEDFNNAVKVYYLSEPKFYTDLGSISADDQEKLSWDTVKAFGDTRDTDVRLLETYQKNIDTNWYEIRKYNEEVLGKYSTMYKKNRESDNQNNKNYKITMNELPSYKKVGINLLIREVEKMYRGNITIIGNPAIEPMDIVHIEDSMNNMDGPIEIEEVIHSFSPTTGYTTTLTPSLITYDRDPIAMSDLSVIHRILTTAESKRSSTRMWAFAQATAAGIASTFAIADIVGGTKIGGIMTLIGTVPAMASSLWNMVVGVEKRYNKFIYDHMANVFGRDCINFSALHYKDKPYMTGFGGVDYTNIKTLINHQWQGLGVIERLATSNDVEGKWIENSTFSKDLPVFKYLLQEDVPVVGKPLYYIMKFFGNDSWGQ